MKDIKILPNERCIAQHEPFACDFRISKRHVEKVCTQEKNMETTGGQCKEWFQVGNEQVQTE